MDDQTQNDQPDVRTDLAGRPGLDNLQREEIARRAYALYEERGCCDGCDVDDWLQAEAEVIAGGAKPAGMSADERPPATAEATRRVKASA